MQGSFERMHHPDKDFTSYTVFHFNLQALNFYTISVRLKIGKVLNRTQSSYQLTKKLRPNIWRATYAGEQVIIKLYGNEGHFFNERYALACIKKENSVRQMIDGIEDSPVLVLEHLDDSLANVSRNKALDSGDLRHVARNVLQALASLHQKQIGHMDVKPENLLVNLVTAGPGRFREVKLADLSFMTLLYNDDVLALGSYGNIFRSPELLLEAPFDASTDIRSLGAISLAWREAGSVTFLAPPAKALARSSAIRRHGLACLQTVSAASQETRTSSPWIQPLNASPTS